MSGSRPRHPPGAAAGPPEPRRTASLVQQPEGHAIHDSVATFVLVHGSWHGGWCWRNVVPLLHRAGHAAYAPTLTGLGERSHLVGPTIGLSTFIQDIVQLFEFEELRDVVLVGHSFGGMVVTGAAEELADRVSRLIYLDAFVPEDGQSLFDILPRSDEVDLRHRARVEGAGWLMPPYPLEVFGITDPDDAAWVQSHLRFMPIRTYEEPVRLGSERARRLPRSYIACSGFPVFAPIRARAKEEGWDYHEMDTAHDAMVTAPRELADLLIALAGG